MSNEHSQEKNLTEKEKQLSQLQAAFDAGILDRQTFEAAAKGLKSDIRILNSQVGGIAKEMKVEGGIHFHGKNDDAEDEDFYLTRVFTYCNQLDTAEIDESCKPDDEMKLDDVFTTLYLDGVRRREDESVAESFRKEKERDSIRGTHEEKLEFFPISAVEAAGVLSRLVILGHPGGGKSTVVNYIAAQLARLRRDGKGEPLPGWPETDKPPLPVRIILRRFAAWIPDNTKSGTEGLVWEYLEHSLKDWGCQAFFSKLRQILETEGGVICFDGLDEVRETDAVKKRTVMVQAIRAFSKPLENCKIIVTCREYAWKKNEDWRLPASDFTVVMLDLFQEEQIRAFTRNWYRVTAGPRKDWSEEKSLAEADNLAESVLTWPRLRDLGRIPLLLTLMAQVHRRDGVLPRDRAELYERAVNLLLAHWENRIDRDAGVDCKRESSEIVRLGIHRDDLKEVLETLALEAHERQGREDQSAEDEEDAARGADIAREDLRQAFYDRLGDWNKAEAVMEFIQVRAGLLHAKDGKTFAFPHRTFQEYLAARAILKRDGFDEFLCEKIEESLDWWREVFLLAAGVVQKDTPGNIRQMIDALVPVSADEKEMNPNAVRCAGLAAQAMFETRFAERLIAGTLPDKSGRFINIYRRVQGWLLEALTVDDVLNAKERVEAGNRLAGIGDPRFNPERWHLPADPNDGFLPVPAGEFMMGEGEERHRVILSAYEIGKFPVTVAQFRVFMEETEYQINDSDFERDNRYANHPVVDVSWNDALKYCVWLSEKLNCRIDLPTEAQWERAARGNDERKYPWGNENIDSERANYRETGLGGTSPVGCFPGGAGPFGGLDIAGNVWEWCADWYGDYPSEPVTDPVGPADGAGRVNRGGSWDFDAEVCRSAYRNGDVPGARYRDRGFRLARLPGQPSKPSGQQEGVA